MAVQHSIRRIPSILLLALLGLAVVAGTASYLSRPEPETTPAAQITATVPLATMTEVASKLRPRNMAPIPKRAPRAATAGTNPARSAQDSNGLNDQAYSLADAMRVSIWRKNTAVRLKFLTASLSACADDTTADRPTVESG